MRRNKDISQQLKLPVIKRHKNTLTINKQLKIGEPDSNFMYINLRSKDYQNYGKLGTPNATLIQEYRDKSLQYYPESSSKAGDPDVVTNMINKIDIEIANGYRQIGEQRSSAGKIFGKDYKGTGTCGNNHECINRAIALIQQYEKRKTEMENDRKDAEFALEKKWQASQASAPGSVGSDAPASGFQNSNTVKVVVWSAVGLTVLIVAAVIIRKARKK